MNTVEEIHDRIQQWVVSTFPLASQGIGIDDSLLDGGIIDSMGTLEVVQLLEDEFSIQVEDEEMVADHFNSIRSIANLIQSKL